LVLFLKKSSISFSAFDALYHVILISLLFFFFPPTPSTTARSYCRSPILPAPVIGTASKASDQKQFANFVPKIGMFVLNSIVILFHTATIIQEILKKR
jgi:hypothetical protein